MELLRGAEQSNELEPRCSNCSDVIVVGGGGDVAAAAAAATVDAERSWCQLPAAGCSCSNQKAVNQVVLSASIHHITTVCVVVSISSIESARVSCNAVTGILKPKKRCKTLKATVAALCCSKAVQMNTGLSSRTASCTTTQFCN